MNSYTISEKIYFDGEYIGGREGREISKEFWDMAQKCSPKLTYCHRENKITLMIKWPEKTNRLYPFDINSNFYFDIVAKIESNNEYDNDAVRRVLINHIVQYLNQLFLAFNIAAPGSFRLYGVKIHFDSIHMEYFHEINLSTDFCSDLDVVSNEFGWPKIDVIPFEKTMLWLLSLKLTTKQVATTQLESTLFAFLNYCHHEISDPISVLWLAHALEAFYHSPSESITSRMRDRIFLFLGSPTRHRNKIRQSINEFFRIRGKIAHGDFDTPIPQGNEVFDPAIESQWLEIMSNNGIIIAIIISSLQKLVIDNKKSISFKETYKYDD